MSNPTGRVVTGPSTISVSVPTEDTTVDVSQNIGARLYSAIDELANKEGKTVEVLREALQATLEANPKSFDKGDHIAGPLIHAFSAWINRSKAKTLAAVADGTLGKNAKDEDHTEKSFMNNELSMFRALVGKEFKAQHPTLSIGFSNKTKEKAIRYTVKLTEAKPKQTVEAWLKAGIAVYGATDVYAAMMKDEDIKIVLDAINQKQGE